MAERQEGRGRLRNIARKSVEKVVKASDELNSFVNDGKFYLVGTPLFISGLNQLAQHNILAGVGEMCLGTASLMAGGLETDHKDGYSVFGIVRKEPLANQERAPQVEIYTAEIQSQTEQSQLLDPSVVQSPGVIIRKRGLFVR